MKSYSDKLARYRCRTWLILFCLWALIHVPSNGFCSILLTLGPEETAKQVALGIQTGSASEVAKNFNTLVDLSIPGYDDTYSKNQAENILKEFFYQNIVKTFKITKRGSSADGSQYSIGELQTTKKVYRVYFLIKAVSGQHLVHQFQIQENN